MCEECECVCDDCECGGDDCDVFVEWICYCDGVCGWGGVDVIWDACFGDGAAESTFDM